MSMKKLMVQSQAVETFNKRMKLTEDKIDNVKSLAETRHEQTKEYVNRTKDMLEGRVNQITQFNDSIMSMGEDLKKMKQGNDDFMEKIMNEVAKVNEKASKTEVELAHFKDRSGFFFETSEIQNEQKSKAIQKVSESIDAFRIDINGKLEEVQFDIDRRMRIDDVS